MSIVIATKIGRHTGIVARQTESFIEVVRLTNRGLDAVRLTEEELIADWGLLTAYTEKEGVERFLKLATTGRCSARARRLLDRLDREYVHPTTHEE